MLTDYRFPKKTWGSFVNSDNQKFNSPEALDFLNGLLKYDHKVFTQ
jgi:casein kinase II subunit alpha